MLKQDHSKAAQTQGKAIIKKKQTQQFNKENTHILDNIRLNLEFQRVTHDDDERDSTDITSKKQAFLYQQQTPDQFNESATIHTQFINSASASQSFCFQGSMHHPIHSINNIEFAGQSNYQNDTIDSNGNEIRGRKIDSPHLVVVREIKEQDEEDYLHSDIMNGFGTGSEDIQNMIWNSRDLRQQNLNESMKRLKKTSKQSKSVENKRKFSKQIQSKNRMFNDLKQANNKMISKGTTSSREIQSSMGFHELLNQLDRDVSIQQSNLVDFKNRTVHDALKLELSGIRRQNNNSKNKHTHNSANKTGSKNLKIKQQSQQQQQQLMKSKERKDQSKPKKQQSNQVFQYALNNINNQTPEKQLHQGPTTTSFLNSEHGRCMTSQGLHTSNSMFLVKGHTKSQTNLGSNNNLINNNKLANYPQTASHYNYQQRNSNSPDRNTLHQIKEFKPIGNIDKLIRENLKKKGKIEVKEKMQKQRSEETLRKKKEEWEQKNNYVRQLNKDKIYKKQYQQTINHQQQASDQVGIIENEGIEKLKKAWNDSNHFKFKLKNHMQQQPSQSQVIEFDPKKQKRFNFKNQRKSYGLDFIDIKREIQDELKTIEEKVYLENQLIVKQKHANTEQSVKKLRIKSSTKQDVIERRSSTERAPISKIIIVKKDKIRKFMKAKKKELIHQQYQQQKDEMTKAQKMQENLIKLNQFCKKKIHKHPALKYHNRKRNATIQVKDEEEKKEQSKFSLKGQTIKQKSQDIEDDSSKISTEFYEEYFRIINSIKKEEQQQESQHKATISESLNLSRSGINQKSKSNMKSPINKIETVQSPVSFNQAAQFLSSPGHHAKQLSQKGTSALKKSKSKGSMVHKELLSGSKKKGQARRPPTTAGQRKNSKENAGIHQQRPHSTVKKSRAESAPLIQQLNSLNRQHSPKRQLASMGSNSERLQFILQQIVKIQRAYRFHLQFKGFYKNYYFNASDYDTEYYAGDTVKRIDMIDELKQFNDDDHEDDNQEQYEEEEEEEDGEEDEDEDVNLIIINKHEIGDDERKVIYMSNINSCSLPQTPKDINQQQQEIKQNVFEYKVDDKFGSVQSQPIQQISSQPSIFAQEVYIANEEEKEQEQNDEYKMRIFTGSESVVKDFKHRTPKDSRMTLNLKDSAQKSMTASIMSSMSSVRNQMHASVDSKSNNEHTSQSSQSLFERNSFQQFTLSKLNQISQNNEFVNLIKMREQALDYREKKEGKILKKMCRNDQISPRTYNSKKQSLEKWVKVEQEEILKTKKAFQEEWQKTVQMIEDTQKNVDLMRKKMKIQIDNQNHHQNAFNSQSSRNSSSSNLATVQQEKRRSILEDEPPISSRSIRVFQFEPKKEEKETNIQKKEQKLIDFLEEKRIQKLNDSQELIEITQKQKQFARQGIYIEDQNDKVIQTPQLPDHEEEKELFNSVVEVSSIQVDLEKDERALFRQRSEQHLSELTKKNRGIEGNNAEQVVKIDTDSFVLESSQKLNQALRGMRIDELQIQENQYEDELNNKDSNHLNSFNRFEDPQSNNESLLNETDLNNYFQEQKFSIEDFKSLDKKKLINHKQNEEEEEDRDEKHFENEEQHIAKNLDALHFKQRQGMVGQVMRTEPDLDDDDDDEFDRVEFQKGQRVQTPEEQVPSIFQQHLLFQNTKPGENIKISDILRKSQSMQHHGLDTSALDSSNTSQMLFQNQQINQSMVVNVSQQQQYPLSQTLADQLTDEIFQMILSQSVQVPQRTFLDQSMVQHPENQDVFVIDIQQNEKDQKREMIEFRQRFLLDQDMQKVDLYINEVIATLLQSELEALSADQNLYQDTPAFHKQFLQVLTNPVKKNELDLLNQLQTSEIGSYDHFETAQELTQFPILPIDLYLEIERMREENQIKQMEDENLENSVVQESVHIMNKAVFDALNESLTKFRPYGIQGEPMPWSNRNRRLQTKVDINSVDTERLFQMVKQDVLRWSQSFAGCIPSQVFSFKNQPNEQDAFDEDLFQETRERRLASMLASEVVETEHQWLNYDFEEAQVKIDLSDMILEHLVEETVAFLCQKNNNNEVWQM